MARITISPDCGNSPRKLFLKKFNIALAEADEEFFDLNLAETVKLTIAGKKEISGKQKVLKALVKLQSWKAKSMVIESIITHGPEAACRGSIKTAADKSVSFAGFFRFRSAGSGELKEIIYFRQF